MNHWIGELIALAVSTPAGDMDDIQMRTDKVYECVEQITHQLDAETVGLPTLMDLCREKDATL